MDWQGWATFGFVATAVLTVILIGAQEFRVTRMDIPTMLGTMVTARPEHAKAAGTAMHLAVGQVFALFYLSAFHLLHFSSWWLGLLFGLVHGALALGLIIPALPALHPRMASERTGPDLPMLEPPAFLAQNYGRRTIVATLVAHAAYGAVLGGFLSPT
jgi:hypothetical protein